MDVYIMYLMCDLKSLYSDLGDCIAKLSLHIGWFRDHFQRPGLFYSSIGHASGSTRNIAARN